MSGVVFGGRTINYIDLTESEEVRINICIYDDVTQHMIGHSRSMKIEAEPIDQIIWMIHSLEAVGGAASHSFLEDINVYTILPPFWRICNIMHQRVVNAATHKLYSQYSRHKPYIKLYG